MGSPTFPLKLRPWEQGDAPSLVKYANNRKVSINLRDRFPFPYTETDAIEWLGVANKNQPVTNFAMEIDANAVGGIGLVIGEDIFRSSAELGYWLGEPYWGNGIATEAVKLTTVYAFDTLKLVRVYAGVFENNPASARVLEKAGYKFESRQAKSVIKDGRILDQLLYVSVC